MIESGITLYEGDRNLFRVQICVATYKRPERLTMLLESIHRIRVPDVNIGILVVDNDATGSARGVVSKFRGKFDFPVCYEIEPKAGISAARNRLVHESRLAEYGWIVFVDDDEIVDPDWLTELWHAAHKYSADVVLGPVDPVYPASTPDWIKDGDFMGRSHQPSGTELEVFNTGNVLIRLSVLDGMAMPFHDSFGLTGGSDTVLSMMLSNTGVKIVWCNEATVWEPVDESRLSLAWILRRAFRVGSVYSRAQLIINPRLSTRLNRIVRGFARLFAGVLQLPLDVVRVGSKAAFARSLQSVVRGIGSIVGAVGIRGFREYDRLDNSEIVPEG